MTPMGHPVASESTGSEASDSPRLPDLIVGIAAESVLADKGYDSDANPAAIHAAGSEPCIPPRRNRTEPIADDRPLYGERNVIERYFAGVRCYRRVATRYDKRAANFPGFIRVASIAILLA